MTKKFTQIRISIISMVLLFLLVLPVIGYAQIKHTNQKASDVPLLLNSGLVQCEEAKGKYILWTEDSEELYWLEKLLQSTGLTWNKELLSDYYGRNAYKYVAVFDIQKENEGLAVEYYYSLHTSLKGTKVRVFFEERIDSALDSLLFFRNYNIPVIQKIQEEEIMSLSGFHRDYSEGVKAGTDQINVQLITRSGKGSGQGRSVLAYPALLEEF